MQGALHLLQVISSLYSKTSSLSLKMTLEIIEASDALGRVSIMHWEM